MLNCEAFASMLSCQAFCLNAQLLLGDGYEMPALTILHVHSET